MTTEFKTAKGNFLLCKLPTDAYMFKVAQTIPPCLDVLILKGGNESIDLPEGQYKIIGLTSELTEEQCKEVVDDCPVDSKTLYASYPLWSDDWVDAGEWEDTAKESFSTLLKDLECFEKNPYGESEPWHCFSDHPDKNKSKQYQQALQRWKQAQERTGSWLLLKREQ